MLRTPLTPDLTAANSQNPRSQSSKLSGLFWGLEQSISLLDDLRWSIVPGRSKITTIDLLIESALEAKDTIKADIFRAMRQEAMNGENMMRGLLRMEKGLPKEIVYSLIEAEKQGDVSLKNVLNSVAFNLRQVQKIRGSISGPIFTGVLMTFFAFCTAIYVGDNVIRGQLNNLKPYDYATNYPTFTFFANIFIGIADYWLWIFLIVALISVGVWYFLTTPLGIYWKDAITLKLPYFKTLTKAEKWSLFATTCSNLLDANIPLPEALERSIPTLGEYSKPFIMKLPNWIRAISVEETTDYTIKNFFRQFPESKNIPPEIRRAFILGGTEGSLLIEPLNTLRDAILEKAISIGEKSKSIWQLIASLPVLLIVGGIYYVLISFGEVFKAANS